MSNTRKKKEKKPQISILIKVKKVGNADECKYNHSFPFTPVTSFDRVLYSSGSESVGFDCGLVCGVGKPPRDESKEGSTPVVALSSLRTIPSENLSRR